MSVHVGLHLGKSFAQASVLNNSTGAPSLFYLGHHQVHEHIRDWLLQVAKDHANDQELHLKISTTHFDKLIEIKNARLGGRVAVILDSGWEPLFRWLRDVHCAPPPESTNLGRKMSKYQVPLQQVGNQDYIFGLTKNENYSGTWVEAPDWQQMKDLSEKISLGKMERVCLFLRGVHHESSAAKKLQTFFGDRKIHTFFLARSPQSLEDLFSLCKSSLLTASFYGLHSEWVKHFTHLQEKDPRWKLDFTWNGYNIEESSRQHLEVLKKNLSSFQHPILHLGLENWSVLNPSADTEAHRFTALRLQPTDVLTYCDQFKTWRFQPSSYDPGPVALGRGLDVTLFDLIRVLHGKPLLEKFESPAALEKIENKFKALLSLFSSQQGPSGKTTQELSGTLEKIAGEMVEALAFEVLSSIGNHQKVIVSGHFANSLHPLLKSLRSLSSLAVEWDIDPQSSSSEVPKVC